METKGRLMALEFLYLRTSDAWTPDTYDSPQSYGQVLSCVSIESSHLEVRGPHRTDID